MRTRRASGSRTPYVLMVGRDTDRRCERGESVRSFMDLDRAMRECRDTRNAWLSLIGPGKQYLSWWVVDARTGHIYTLLNTMGARNVQQQQERDPGRLW